MWTGTYSSKYPKEISPQCTTVSGLRLVHRLRSRGGYTECKTFETSSISCHFWLVQIGSLPNHIYSYSIQLGIMKARNLSILRGRLKAKSLYQITSLLSLTVWNSTTQTRSLISARLIFLLGTFTRGYCRKLSINFVIYIITGGLLTVVMESRRRTWITVIFINVRDFSLFCERRDWIAFVSQGMFGMELKNRGITGISYPVVSFPSLECWKLSYCQTCLLLNNTLRQGFPNLKTIDYWLGGNNTERFPQSRSVPILKNAKGG